MGFLKFIKRKKCFIHNLEKKTFKLQKKTKLEKPIDSQFPSNLQPIKYNFFCLTLHLYSRRTSLFNLKPPPYERKKDKLPETKFLSTINFTYTHDSRQKLIYE